MSPTLQSPPRKQTLVDEYSTVKINGRVLGYLRFIDHIDRMGRTETEIQELTATFANRARAYCMEMSTEKRKVVVSSCQDVKVKIQIYIYIDFFFFFFFFFFNIYFYVGPYIDVFFFYSSFLFI